MSDSFEALSSMAMEHARLTSSINDMEHNLALLKRDCGSIRQTVDEFEHELKDAIVLGITDHAFTQLMSRFEKSIMMDPVAYDDVYNEPVHSSILSPSGFRSFIITILANAFHNGQYEIEDRKEGLQYKYIIEINKWKPHGVLEFVAIVKKNKLITGFFNWS